MYDIIILGAGPAGISAAIYALSRGKKTLVLEQNTVGGLIGKVSTVTHYSAIVSKETGASFAKRLNEQALEAGAEIRYETALEVSLSGPIKTVRTDQGTYEAAKIILATGTTPARLNIPGEEKLRGHGMAMNAARDGEAYRGKHVYVIGGADGAVKEALYLAGIASQVTIIHFEDKLGAIPQFSELVAAASNIDVKLHTRLTAIHGEMQVEQLELTDEHTGAMELIPDSGCGIFVYIGSTPNTTLFSELILDHGFIPANEKMETAIPGVYAVGDIRTKQVRQVATAVADGAIAAINASL